MKPGIRNDIAVVDTNIVSKFAARRPFPDSDYYRARIGPRILFISFITVHEIRWGIRKAGFGPRRKQEILADLDQYIVEWPSDELMDVSVELRYLCRHRQLSTHDLFVASTAMFLNCPLITDDGRLAEALADAGIPAIISRHLQHAEQHP